MNNDKFVFQSIGVIHSPHKEISKVPIQPVFCKDIEGRIILNIKYVDGLKDLLGFSHVYLFYYFHQSRKICLCLKPYLSDQKHGIFATRAPHRPNKIGMSLVRLVKIKDNILYVKDIDILDNTPLLDIKPYIQRFDSKKNTRSGWQDTITDNIASMRGLRHFKKEKEK